MRDLVGTVQTNSHLESKVTTLSSEISSKNNEKCLFVSDRGTHLITHDGYMQLGCFYHTLDNHRKLNPGVNWVEVYWIQDKFGVRYPRVTWQHTEKANEGSPRTDNATDCRPRDFPDEGSCVIIQESNRLERTL